MFTSDRTTFDQRYINAILHCEKCSARADALLPVPPVGFPETARVLVVGRNPGQEENRICIPFVGASGAKVEELLNQLNLLPADVVICNLVACHTTANRKPTRVEIDKCSPYVQYLIAKMPNIDVVLPLGDQAVKFFLPEAGKISEIAGIIYPSTINERPIKIIPSLHPGGVLRTGTRYLPLMEYVKAQLYKALNEN